MIRSIVALVAALVAACATAMAADLSGYIVLSVGRAAAAPCQTLEVGLGSAFGVRTARYSAGEPADFSGSDGEGTAIVLKVAPGTWAVDRLAATGACQAVAGSRDPDVPPGWRLPLKFKIQARRAVYIGSFTAVATQSGGVHHWSIPGGGLVRLENRLGRDEPIARRKVQGLPVFSLTLVGPPGLVQ